MMKTKLFALTAVAVAMLATQAARADIIGPTTVNYAGLPGGSTLQLTYDVSLSGSIYTYTYTLASTPGEGITSFTIGGAPDPVYTAGAVMGLTSGAISSTIGGNFVTWTWNAGSAPTNATVSFTSPFGPGMFTFGVQDTGVTWSAPPEIPAPVPEASTVMAGALMLLPLGIGAFRALRKERKA